MSKRIGFGLLVAVLTLGAAVNDSWRSRSSTLGSATGAAARSADRADARRSAPAAARVMAKKARRQSRPAIESLVPGSRRAGARPRAGKAPAAAPSADAARGLAATTIPSANRIRLAASDGHIALPGRGPLYVFGFNKVTPFGASLSTVVSENKGKAMVPAPIIASPEDQGYQISMTNVGLQFRPDLDDSHTVHWHGFRNAMSIFDGTPELSISVGVNRTFPYQYIPRDAGTYIYHCHFEDSEHVQMGMTGIVFVRPNQDGVDFTGDPLSGKYVYNDGDGSTAFDREYALLLNEIDVRPHDMLEAVQEFVWSDYDPNYWIINGRSYPDTIEPNKGEAGEDSPRLDSQPISSLIQAKPGNKVLLRFASLGYEQHAMQLTGIQMKVVGEDATLLRGPGGADLSYRTNTIYIGPGESRDVIFEAPPFNASAIADSDGIGSYNRYLLKNRNYHKQTNDGAADLGGMVTEVRVYAPSATLPAQTAPNQTFGQ